MQAAKERVLTRAHDSGNLISLERGIYFSEIIRSRAGKVSRRSRDERGEDLSERACWASERVEERYIPSNCYFIS